GKIITSNGSVISIVDIITKQTTTVVLDENIVDIHYSNTLEMLFVRTDNVYYYFRDFENNITLPVGDDVYNETHVVFSDTDIYLSNSVRVSLKSGTENVPESLDILKKTVPIETFETEISGTVRST